MISSMEQGKDGGLAVLAASDTKPAEVHALENGELRVLTHHNDDLMAKLKWARRKSSAARRRTATKSTG